MDSGEPSAFLLNYYNPDKAVDGIACYTTHRGEAMSLSSIIPL